MNDALPPAIRVVGAGVVAAADATIVEGTPPVAVRRAAFEPRDLPNGIGRRLGRQPALALAAILDALGPRSPEPETALVLGTAHGAVAETVDCIAGAAKHGAAGASPLLFANSLHSSMAGSVGRTLGIRGPTMVVSNGPSTFHTAVLMATSMLGSGRAREVIVCASDAYHSIYIEALRVLGEFRPGRPHHPIGEGAGALVLRAAPPGSRGVRIAHAGFAAAATAPKRPLAHVHYLTSGEPRDVARHGSEWEALGRRFASPRPLPTQPAARYGVFGSLGAVVTAAEARRRLNTPSDSGPDDSGSTAILEASAESTASLLVLDGHGTA